MAKKKAAVQPAGRRQCGSMAVYERLSEMHDSFRFNQERIENLTREYVNSAALTRERRLLFRIPVVVHCVYRTNAEKITLAQAKSQIKVLNKDYRLKNTDRKKVPAPWKSLAADAGIEFHLVDQDPNGDSFNGVTFTKTERTSFGTGDTIKRSSDGGVDPWDTRKYLNMWVGNLAGGLLGYAQFPGGPRETDGVVVAMHAFGTSGTARAPFNKGRTATHEVGHYLNLFHIWGDTNDCSGTDYCSDTPAQKLPNYGTPDFPHVSCSNGPNGDMFMNYMDYVDDAAMVMFTQAQAARMVATLTGPRDSLATVETMS
jgi:Pregnancy-associated plasma protein-A